MTMVWDRGLMKQVTNAVGVTVSFDHDEHGDLVSATDAAGNVARLVRDACGRVVQAISPSGTDHAVSLQRGRFVGLTDGS